MNTNTTPKSVVGTFDALIPRLALSIKHDLDAADLAYSEEVDHWYRAGEGRRRRMAWFCEGEFIALAANWHPHDRSGFELINLGGENHRFPYCRHGANLWVDHDIPCGICESDYVSNYEIALGRARTAVRQFESRLDAFNSAVAVGMPIDKVEVINWVGSPVNEIASLDVERKQRYATRVLP